MEATLEGTLCTTCDGTGSVIDSLNLPVQCPKCEGNGRMCARCKGSGIEPDPSPEAVDIAMCTDSGPIACCNCAGWGSVCRWRDEWLDRL